MGYYRYTGKNHISDTGWNRIQVQIVDLETNSVYLPSITRKNKSFGRFWNHAEWLNTNHIFGNPMQIGFHFTGTLVHGWSPSLRNVKIFLDEKEFKEKFAEFLI